MLPEHPICAELSSSILYSLKPAGVTPLIGAPDSEACIRVSRSSSALTIFPLRTNGSRTHIAINAKTLPILSKLRFVFVFFIFLLTFLNFVSLVLCKKPSLFAFSVLQCGQCRIKDKNLNNFSQKKANRFRLASYYKLLNALLLAGICSTLTSPQS